MIVNQPFDNVRRPTTRLRFWLIRMLAGKSTIIMNANIDMELVTDEALASFRDLDGALIRDCTFPVRCGLRLRISSRKQPPAYTTQGESHERQ